MRSNIYLGYFSSPKTSYHHQNPIVFLYSHYTYIFNANFNKRIYPCTEVVTFLQAHTALTYHDGSTCLLHPIKPDRSNWSDKFTAFNVPHPPAFLSLSLINISNAPTTMPPISKTIIQRVFVVVYATRTSKRATRRDATPGFVLLLWAASGSPGTRPNRNQRERIVLKMNLNLTKYHSYFDFVFFFSDIVFLPKEVLWFLRQ